MPIVVEQTATVAAYSGWSNRETWIMNLWLANDETYCDEVRRKRFSVAGFSSKNKNFGRLLFVASQPPSSKNSI